MRAEDYRSEKESLAGVPITVETYKIGTVYYCHIANVDPGAIIARAQGSSRERAIEAALQKTKSRLA